MKKKYLFPYVQVCSFAGADILTASGGFTFSDHGMGDGDDIGNLFPS